MRIKIGVLLLFILIVVIIYKGFEYILNLKEGLKVPYDEGLWNIENLNDYIKLDLNNYGIVQALTKYEFANNCIKNGPDDIATLIVIGTANNFEAYYSTKEFVNSKYNKSSSQQSPQSVPTAISGPTEARVLLKHSILSDSPKDKKYISAYSYKDDTTLWDYDGSEKWNLYAKTDETGKKGVLICNENNKCIISHNKSSNLDESLNLHDKPKDSYEGSRKIWKLTKYGDKYTICTRVKLDNGSESTHVCLQPWVHSKSRGGKVKRVTQLVGANMGYNENQEPPSSLLWQLDGLPENFMK